MRYACNSISSLGYHENYVNICKRVRRVSGTGEAWNKCQVLSLPGCWQQIDCQFTFCLQVTVEAPWGRDRELLASAQKGDGATLMPPCKVALVTLSHCSAFCKTRLLLCNFWHILQTTSFQRMVLIFNKQAQVWSMQHSQLEFESICKTRLLFFSLYIQGS